MSIKDHGMNYIDNNGWDMQDPQVLTTFSPLKFVRYLDQHVKQQNYEEALLTRYSKLHEEKLKKPKRYTVDKFIGDDWELPSIYQDKVPVSVLQTFDLSQNNNKNERRGGKNKRFLQISHKTTKQLEIARRYKSVKDKKQKTLQEEKKQTIKGSRYKVEYLLKGYGQVNTLTHESIDNYMKQKISKIERPRRIFQIPTNRSSFQ